MISWLGMDKQPFEITNRLAGFNSLPNCNSCLLIEIDGILVINDSSITLLKRNIQNVLFEIFDINNTFFWLHNFSIGYLRWYAVNRIKKNCLVST